MEWKKVKLGDYFDLYQPRTITIKDLLETGDYLVYGANGVIGKYDKYNHENSEVLMTCRGATCGEMTISEPKSWINGNAMVVKPKTETLDKKYIFFALRSVNKSDIITGAAQPQITRKTLAPLEVALPFKDGKPDLSEQKRIVSELDKILLLQKLTVLDIQKTKNLFSSICKEHFEGKGISSKKKKLDNECLIIKGQSPTQKTKSGEYTFVVTSEKRKTADTFQFNGEAVCIPLVSSTGHGHASLHRIHYEKGKFALASIMVAIVPKNRNSLMAKYLYYYLSFYKDELLVPLMRGVANVTIPLYKINDVVIEIPKINHQEKLITALEEAEKLKQNLLNRHELIERCLQSTLNYAFQGKI